MTHPDGGSGTGPSGPAGPSPREQTAHERGTAHMDAVLGATLARLGTSIASPRTVREVDAMGSIADLRAAAYIREGVSTDALDRNGWPDRAGRALHDEYLRSGAMRGNPGTDPGTNPFPQPKDPAAPPPPRLKPTGDPVDTNDPQPAGPPPPVA